MPLLNTADAIYLGSTPVDRVYMGATEVWPGGGGPTPTQYAAARFTGNAQYARSPALTLGGVGATNFEIQALVYIEGAYTTEDRVLMAQFPASRQAGVFVSNLFIDTSSPVKLVTGDSQAGSTGGTMDGGATATGKWCLVTFSANGTVAPTGLWRGSIEALDASIAYTAGGRTKGVESSLQANRVDLNGGGVDNGWTNGIRYAEVRAYNAQRSDAQRQLDLTNTDPTGAVFWWRFSDNGSGGLAVADLTGNGRVPTIVGGSLATGPLF